MYAIADEHEYLNDRHLCERCGVRTLSVCGSLQEPDISELEHLAHAKRYHPRQTLFSEREPVEHVFNVRKGMVRLYRLLSDGRRQILGFALRGDFVGLSLRGTCDFTAETVDDVEVCRFDRGAFIDFVDSKPNLLRSLHQATAQELCLGREQMVLLGRRTAEEKIAAFLLSLRARYRRVLPCDVTVPLPMTRQDIADYCGLTLETVSRVLSKLAREKTILIVPGGVRLVMLDRLAGLIA